MLKLYETPAHSGKPAYWWTQRNALGICFEIRQRMHGKFAVIVNEEKAFAVCNSFTEAERELREAEKIYEKQFV